MDRKKKQLQADIQEWSEIYKEVRGIIDTARTFREHATPEEETQVRGLIAKANTIAERFNRDRNGYFDKACPIFGKDSPDEIRRFDDWLGQEDTGTGYDPVARSFDPSDNDETRNDQHNPMDYEPRVFLPGMDKRHAALFGKSPKSAWKSQREWMQAILSGRYHPDLYAQRGMSEGMLSEGGFLVPTEYESQIHNVSVESEIVFGRSRVYPMTSKELKIPATKIGNHSENLFGGVVFYWKGEGADLTSSAPKTREMTLTAHKLTGFTDYTTEWAEDAPNATMTLQEIFGQALGWTRDRVFLVSGNGAGMPISILNSDCLITVSKETNQAAGSITYRNLTGMLSRLWPGSFNNSVFLAHPTTLPELLEISVPIGTGGSLIPVLRENSGTFSVLTRPIIFTEKLNPLGSLGDIMLCDFSQYSIGLRSGYRFETSIGPYFSSDKVAARLISRFDGQPLWNEALTLADGSTTVSPFVTLEAR